MKPFKKLEANLTQKISPIVSLFIVGTVLLSGVALFLFIKSPPEERVYEEFTFAPQDDNLYENPDNWSPSYPGTHIQEGQLISIQGMAYATYYDIVIDGKAIIGREATLYSFSGNLTMGRTGELVNFGELMVNRLINHGRVINHMAGSVDVLTFEASDSGVTDNLNGADFKIATTFTNSGVFNNYSVCVVKEKFINHSVFNQLRGGKLVYRGANAILNSHKSSFPVYSQAE